MSSIPAAAILHLHDREWVYAPLSQGHFKRLEVVSGAMLPGNMQEVVSGLKPGDQVVSNALPLQNTVEQYKNAEVRNQNAEVKNQHAGVKLTES